jgi:hypothetical protein
VKGASQALIVGGVNQPPDYFDSVEEDQFEGDHKEHPLGVSCHEGSIVLRRIGIAVARLCRQHPQAIGANRIPSDSLVCDEIFRLLRAEGFYFFVWVIGGILLSNTS